MSNRPRTAEELLVLPEGPRVEFDEYILTETDRKNGFIFVYGNRRITLSPETRSIRFPKMPAVVVTFHDHGDIVAAVDADGSAWTIGCYADGAWFRQRM